MPQIPISYSANAIDLTPRFPGTKTVAASPTDATETIIGTLTIPDFNALAVVSGIHLTGWAAFTVGTSGTAGNLRIRQTNASGTVVAATGALTMAATNLVALTVLGFDATPAVGVYVLTLQVTAGAAASTVSALSLRAVVS